MAADVANIVFTKNRPLQLEGYLRSLYSQYSPDIFQTYIIYKEELFSQQYQEVFQSYPDIIVIRENNFHRDFFDLIKQINSKYILFGIDDVAYFDKVDFDLIDKTFETAADKIFGFSLRFSPQSLVDGSDEIYTTDIAGQNIFSLDWTKGRTPHSRYPFELCCTFYKTSLVKEILNNSASDNTLAQSLFSPGSGLANFLPYKLRRKIFKRFGFIFSPNTLESWPCRWCQKNSDKLPKFIYFQKLCASAIQVNMVNTSTKNIFDGGDEYTVEVLNEKFCRRYRLDLDYLTDNKPPSLSAGREYFKLTKVI